MTMPTLLFIDSDEQTLRTHIPYFIARGYTVETVSDTEQAYAMALTRDYDCIILDAQLGCRESGFQLCQEIRTAVNSPILFLSGTADPDRVYLAFGSGADDFVRKPCDLKELQLRIDVLIRRYRGDFRGMQTISFPPLTISTASRRVWLSGREIALTSREFDVLALLGSRPNHPVSPSHIYSRVWHMPDVQNNHAVQVHVSNLRRKLERVYPEHNFIQAIWGKGYLFVPPVSGG